jgi:hypothetical protein
MQASKIIELYNAGKRDFRGLDLSGQSLRKQDLAGADFSRTNIKGTNFEGARLKSAKFREAKSGIKIHWLIILIIISILILGVSALLLGFASGWIGVFLSGNENPRMPIAAIFSLILLTVFLNATTHKGLGAAFGDILISVISIFVCTIITAFAINISVAVDIFVGFSFTGAFLIAGATAVAIGLSLAIACLAQESLLFLQ